MKYVLYIKKGDAAVPGNNRPIGLLPHSYKVSADVIKRTMGRIEEVIADEQVGFRPGRGTADQIFTLSQIIERHWEYDCDIY